MLCRALAILACLSSVVFAETPSEPVTIPLKDIWAYKMPGTKAVSGLEQHESDQLKWLPPEQFEKRFKAMPVEQIIMGIRSYLSMPRNAFVVKGTGREALDGAKAVIVDQGKSSNSLSTSTDISIVFFAESSRFRCHLISVQIQKHKIVISYRLEPYLEEVMTYQFALIALGKLDAGTYSVDVLRLPTDPKFKNLKIPEISKEGEERSISRPFSFSVF